MAINTNARTGDLSIISTDGGAGSGPVLTLRRDSASPADSDALGRIDIIGKNDASEDITYVQISAFINDVSDGTEDGSLAIATIVEGEASGGYITINRHTINLVSTLDDATLGPAAVLFRDSASPADDDLVGSLIWQARTDLATVVNYGEIAGTVKDVTDGDEDFQMDFDLITGGVEVTYMEMGEGTIRTFVPTVVTPGAFLELTPVSKATLTLGVGLAGLPPGSMTIVSDDAGAPAFIGAVVNGAGTWVRMDDWTTAIS